MMGSSNGVSNLVSSLNIVDVLEIRIKNPDWHSCFLGKLENKLSVDLVKAFENVNRASSKIEVKLLQILGSESSLHPSTLCSFTPYHV